MKSLDRFEKRFGFIAIPNVVLILIIAQLVMYAAIMIGRVDYNAIQLFPRAVLEGQWWRLFSFILSPPWVADSLPSGIFLAFFWYILWMMSSALEQTWGAFRFNAFLLIGIFFTIIGAFVGQFISSSALIHVSPYYLELSVFFAFATLFPNVEFLLFFVVPVKVKWLAWFAAAMTMVSVVGALSYGAFGIALAVVSPLTNYILFFHESLTQSVKSRKRRSEFNQEQRVVDSGSLHTCDQCGASDATNPDRDFRYKIVEGDAVCICSECR